MSNAPSYNVPEIAGLEEAYRILSDLRADVVRLHPIWEKLYHACQYIQKRQAEELAETLSPEGVA